MKMEQEKRKVGRPRKIKAVEMSLLEQRIGNRFTIKIKDFGYTYLLVEGITRAQNENLRTLPQPEYKGYKNMALLACWKTPIILEEENI
jgi:hypothetical protein